MTADTGSLRDFFGAEVVHWRRLRGLSQHELASRVLHSRALVASVEAGQRWPSQTLALGCDEALETGGALGRLWPVVEAHRLATRRVFAETRLSTIRDLVLRMAALTGTDLSALTASDDTQSRSEPPYGGPG
jgi:transcriptional regulator with XRE-family HTH domain